MENTKILLSPYKIFLVGMLGFAQGIIYLLPYLSGPFYDPMMEMLGCTNEQLGSLMSIMGIVMWVTLIPGGWMADKFETRKLVAVSLVATGVIGVSLVFFINFTYFYIMWGVMSAISNLLYWSAAIKFVRIVATTDEQGKAYGYSYAFNGLAVALFGFMGVALLAMAGDDTVAGLKNIILCYSGFSIAAGVAIWVLFKNVKAADGTSLGDEEKPTFVEMLSVLKYKETWIFSIICFCLYALQCMVLSYFTPFFTDVIGLSEAAASAIYSASNVIAVFSPIVVGVFADKISSIIKTIMLVMVVLIVFLATMLAVNQSIPVAGAIIIDVCAVALAGGAYSIQFSAFDEIKLDRKVAGCCVAMASMIGYSSDVFIWTLFGSFLDNYGNDGYSMIFGCLLAMAVIALACTWILGKMADKSKSISA